MTNCPLSNADYHGLKHGPRFCRPPEVIDGYETFPWKLGTMPLDTGIFENAKYAAIGRAHTKWHKLRIQMFPICTN